MHLYRMHASPSLLSPSPCCGLGYPPPGSCLSNPPSLLPTTNPWKLYKADTLAFIGRYDVCMCLVLSTYTCISMGIFTAKSLHHVEHPPYHRQCPSLRAAVATSVECLRNEAEVQAVVSIHVCKQVLQPLAKHSSHLQPGWVPEYQQQYSYSRATESRLTCAETPIGLRPDEQQAGGQQANTAAGAAAGKCTEPRIIGAHASNPTSISSSRLRTDITLVLVNQQLQQQQLGDQQAPAALCQEPERPALVVEVKRMALLMSADGTPMDLPTLYQHEQQGITGPGQGVPRVQPLLAQVGGTCEGVGFHS